MARLAPVCRGGLHALVATIVILAGSIAAADEPAPPASLTVLTWEAFISPKVLKTFKNREGLDVKVIEFTSPEQREKLLRERRDEIDVVVADTIWSGEYKRRGILEKLDATRIPTLKHTMTRWRSDPDFAVPYMWGHTGIAWRTDLVKAPPANYAELFAFAAQNPGKVSLLDDPHEALRAAMYAFGKPPYAMDTPVLVTSAARLLRPHLDTLRIVGSELGDNSPWVKGEIIAGQAFNGDIAYLRDTYKLPLAFAIPSPGCMIFQEQMVLLKTTKHRDAAYRFLTLINEPGYAARNATDVHYATSNALAVPNLGKAFRDDPIIRPTFDGLDGCYFYTAFNAATQATLNSVNLVQPRTGN